MAEIVERYSAWLDPVLEVGVGSGAIAKYLRNKRRYTGYEPSPAMAKALTEGGLNIRCALVPPLMEADKSQQVVFAIHVLEHFLHYREASEFLTEAHRVLKDSGKLILSFPDCRSMGIDFYSDYSHSYITVWPRVQNMLSDCGFEIIRKNLLFGAVPNPWGYFLYIPSKIILPIINFVFTIISIDCTKLSKINYTLEKGYLVVCRKKK